MQGDIATSILCPFGTFFPVLVSWSKKNLATLLRRLARPLRKDDTQNRVLGTMNVLGKKSVGQ
jgi:hypothetical protein